MVTSSSDVPMKGLVPLLEAVAKLRTERDVELVVIGRPTEGGRVARTIERLGLGRVVKCFSGISDDELAGLYAEAQVAVVPSLYEGFSLPAIEAMACGVPLLATTGGALPEVVGTTARRGSWCPPTTPRPWLRGSGRSWTIPPWPSDWAGVDGTGSSAVHLGGDGPGDGRAVPGRPRDRADRRGSPC